ASVVIAGVAGATFAWFGARLFYLRRSHARVARGDPATVGAMVEESVLSDAQYHLLFDHNPIPTFVCETRRWGCLEVNKAAVNGYGYSRQEFLKIRFTDLSPAEEAERMS